MAYSTPCGGDADNGAQAFLKTQGRPAAATFEQPKGANSLFVKLVCVPSFLDTKAIIRGAQALVLKLSQLAVLLSVLIVPACLWHLRELARPHDGQPWAQTARAVGPTALVDLLLLLGAEAIVERWRKAKAARGAGLLTAANIQQVVRGAPPPPPPPPSQRAAGAAPGGAPAAGSSSTQAADASHAAPQQASAAGEAASSAAASSSRAGSAPSAEASSSTTQAAAGASAPAAAVTAAAAAAAAAAAPGSAAPAAAAGSRQSPAVSASGAGARPSAAAAGGTDWAAVRQLVIKLEFEVFGNELNAGVLPSDVLPSRVHKLCDEVGVAFPPGTATPAGLLSLLEDVRRVVGI